METITGVFKNADTTLTITSTPKDFTDIVDPTGHLKPTDLGAFFGRALAEDVGTCTLARGATMVEMTYTFSKGFLTTKDATGNESVFAFRFDKLFFLDPNGVYSLILGR